MMLRCFKSYQGWAVLGLAGLVGGYLVIWHGAHLAAVLPFLVLAACPLTHIFMHGSHGHHHQQDTSKGIQPTPSPTSRSTSDKGE